MIVTHNVCKLHYVTKCVGGTLWRTDRACLLCVLQPCPESGDFREQQCSAYNEVPYEGTLLLWTPHHDDSEPCALTCRGRPAGEPLTQEEPIVVQLAPKVQDGTRCRPGSLDMCINGKCQVCAALSVCTCGILPLALRKHKITILFVFYL